jgi:hypothetical protein
MKNIIKLSALTLFCFTSLMVNAQTATRDNAGLQGDAGAVSGFFETVAPVNYPAGASTWWHLLDVRHSNNNNNYAMQFSGSFFNQELYFRKTSGNPSQQWSRILMESDGSVYVGTEAPENNEHWNKVIGVKGNGSSKALVSTANIISGIWSHDTGFYGAPSGGITGTYSNHPFSIITGAATRLTISNNGNVGIGTINPTDALTVAGQIGAREIKVSTNAGADFVFDPAYKLPELAELEKFVKANKHLPEVPTAKQMVDNGVNLGELNIKLLQKVEELTLYLIDKDKKIDALIKRVESLEENKTKSNKQKP